MATLTLEECRECLPGLEHLSDEQIIKIRDNLTFIINSLLNRLLSEHKAKAIADKARVDNRGKSDK